MKVKVNPSGTSQVVSVGVQGPAGPASLSAAADVDVTDLKDGSLLAYSIEAQKWVATTILEKQTLEGGHF